jgi:hypothetical protein
MSIEITSQTINIENVRQHTVRPARPPKKILNTSQEVRHYSNESSALGKRRLILYIFHDERYTTICIEYDEDDWESIHLYGIDITQPASPHAETVSLMFHQTPVHERYEVIDDLSKLSHKQLQTICSTAAKGVKYMFESEMCTLITFGKTAWDFQSINLAHWHLRGLSEKEENSAQIINLSMLTDSQIVNMFSDNKRGVEACYELARIIMGSELDKYFNDIKIYSSGAIEFSLNRNLVDTLNYDAADIWLILEKLKKQAWDKVIDEDASKNHYDGTYAHQHLAAASVFYQRVNDKNAKLNVLFALHMPDGKSAKGGPIEAMGQTAIRDVASLGDEQLEYERDFHLRNRAVVTAICGGTLNDDPQKDRLIELGWIKNE